MEDFKTRKLNTARQNKNIEEQTEKEIKSEKKKKISFSMDNDPNFKPTTRVRDMKELIERRHTVDTTSTPNIISEESKTIDLNVDNLKYSFTNKEESKSSRIKEEENKPRFKRGSMRIYYMAKALEYKLHQKRDDNNNEINKDDPVFQIMMDKPLVSTKKPSRSKLSL